MQGRLFDNIQGLDKSRTNWRLKARLTRFWPTFSPETSTIKGYNLILLDDDNSHIHAYVYPDNWRAIGKEVTEGLVYIIENFQVRDVIGRLKPVSTKICIRLLNTTTIDPVEDDPMIPLHKFEFMDLGDLLAECKKYSNSENPEYAVDVIGVVENFQKVRKVPTRYGDREKCQFKLTDGSTTHQVTMWGDLAKTVSDKHEASLEKPVIGILTSLKLSIFREELQLGALPSTKIFFNLNCDSVTDFRERLAEEGYKTSESSNDSSSASNSNMVIEMTSFKDLIDNCILYTFKRSVMVSFTINKVEEEDNWWYFSCIVCHHEVEKVDKKFNCPDCQRSFSYAEKRFRIFVLADDSSLATNVILLDRVVKRIVGTTVTNILNEIKKVGSSEVVTELFKNITGKQITAVFKLSDGNINGDSNLYEAVDLCDPVVAERAIVDVSPAQPCNSFNFSGEMAGIELFQTPGSSRSVSKKIKVEDSAA